MPEMTEQDRATTVAVEQVQVGAVREQTPDQEADEAACHSLLHTDRAQPDEHRLSGIDGGGEHPFSPEQRHELPVDTASVPGDVEELVAMLRDGCGRLPEVVNFMIRDVVREMLQPGDVTLKVVLTRDAVGERPERYPVNCTAWRTGDRVGIRPNPRKDPVVVPSAVVAGRSTTGAQREGHRRGAPRMTLAPGSVGGYGDATRTGCLARASPLARSETLRVGLRPPPVTQHVMGAAVAGDLSPMTAVVPVNHMCIVGATGLSSTLVRIVARLHDKARGDMPWLYWQMTRTLGELEDDRELDLGALLVNRALFNNSAWRYFGSGKRTNLHSPYHLCLNDWIVLIAVHGAHRVNTGPAECGMWALPVNGYKWRDTVRMLSGEVILTVPRTDQQHHTTRTRFLQSRTNLVAAVRERLQDAPDRCTTAWPTQQMHLSEELVQTMVRMLEIPSLTVTRLGPDQARICRADPSIFDTVFYALGRAYTPNAPFFLGITPVPTAPLFTAPWTWAAPYDRAGFYLQREAPSQGVVTRRR